MKKENNTTIKIIKKKNDRTETVTVSLHNIYILKKALMD